MFRLVPVLQPFVTLRGAEHRPAGIGLRGRIGIGSGLVPLLAAHEVPGDVHAHAGMVESEIFLLEKLIEDLLPLVEMAALFVRLCQRPIGSRVCGHLEVATQMVLGFIELA